MEYVLKIYSCSSQTILSHSKNIAFTKEQIWLYFTVDLEIIFPHFKDKIHMFCYDILMWIDQYEFVFMCFSE